VVGTYEEHKCFFQSRLAEPCRVLDISGPISNVVGTVAISESVLLQMLFLVVASFFSAVYSFEVFVVNILAIQVLEEDNWTPELSHLMISAFCANSVKEQGIPLILTTLPCNGFAFELKNKKNHLLIK
jgi:hypothetical protein